MASVQLQPPSSFDFKDPDSWPRWKRRFEQFRMASGLSGEDDLKQVSALLYCMGEDAEDMLSSTNVSEDDRMKYDKVINKLDAFFQVRKNVIFECARFNRRSQKPDESAEQFITSLYYLAENCAYGDLKKEMIRDRIVVGIRDGPLSQKLQLESDLTLERAKTLVRQREAVHEQQALLRHAPRQELSVDFVKRRPPFNKSKGPKTAMKGSQSPASKCSRCGKGPHSRQACPAKDVVCHKCGKKGHYSSQCFSKVVTEVTMTSAVVCDPSYDTSYLTAVSAGKSSTSWNTTIVVNGQELSFKLDTGAEVTAISDGALQLLKEKELQSSNKRL